MDKVKLETLKGFQEDTWAKCVSSLFLEGLMKASKL
jgi:hypothetical protein